MAGNKNLKRSDEIMDWFKQRPNQNIAISDLVDQLYEDEIEESVEMQSIEHDEAVRNVSSRVNAVVSRLVNEHDLFPGFQRVERGVYRFNMFVPDEVEEQEEEEQTKDYSPFSEGSVLEVLGTLSHNRVILRDEMGDLIELKRITAPLRPT